MIGTLSAGVPRSRSSFKRLRVVSSGGTLVEVENGTVVAGSARLRGARLGSPGRVRTQEVGGDRYRALAQPLEKGPNPGTLALLSPQSAIDDAVGVRLTSRLTATGGYNFTYVSRVVRPGDQVGPTFNFNQTDFWAHGASAGLSLTY